MKCLALSFLLLLAAVPSQAAFSLVQHGFFISTDTNAATTAAASYSSATLIIISCNIEDGGGDPAITDSSSNVWVHIRSDVNSGGTLRTSMWYLSKPAVSASQTFTCTSTGRFPSIFVQGWSGNGISAVTVDQQSGNADTTCTDTTNQPGSITPLFNNELLVSDWQQNVQSVGITINSSFTISDSSAGTSNGYGGGLAYIVQTTAGAANPTWSWTTASCTNAGIVSFTLLPQTGYVLRQHSFAVSSNNNTATTPAANYTGATLEVVGCVTDTGGGDPTITDSNSNTWTHIRSDTGNGSTNFLYVSWWYVINPTGTLSAQTFTCTQTGLFPGIFVTGWSGNASSSLVDQQCGQVATGNQTTWQPCVSTVTPGHNNEVLLAFSGQSVNAVTNITVDSSFIRTDYNGSGSNNFGGAMSFLVQTTATGVNPTFTYSGSSFEVPTASIITLNPTAASGTNNRPLGIF